MVTKKELKQFMNNNKKQATTLKENPFKKKKIYIEIASETYDKLVKYIEENEKLGNIILLDAMMDRIMVAWYEQAVPQYNNNPDIVPKLTGKAPSNLNQIKANKVHYTNFKRYAESLNFNIPELLTWLTEMFIKTWDLVERRKVLHERNVMK